jgi:hypothetical protein
LSVFSFLFFWPWYCLRKEKTDKQYHGQK